MTELICPAHKLCKDVKCYHMQRHEKVVNCHVACAKYGGPSVSCDKLIPNIEHGILIPSIEHHFKWLSENT